MKLRKILLGLIGLLYVAGLTALLCLWRFPWDPALDSLARLALARGGPELRFGPAAFGWGGLRIEGILAEWPLKPRPLQLETGRLRIWPRLLGMGAELELAGGNIEAGAGLGSAWAEARGVELARSAGLAKWTGGSVRGLLDARADAAWTGPAPEQWSGKLRLRIEGLDLEQVRLGELPLERLPLGRLELLASLAEGSGRVQIEQLESAGGDLELSGSGSIALNADPGRSQLDLKLKLKLAGQMRENAGDLLSAVLGTQPDEQGWLHLTISGPLTRPKLN